MTNPEERRLAIIRLHAQGWVEEGVRGLADKSRANTGTPALLCRPAT